MKTGAAAPVFMVLMTGLSCPHGHQLRLHGLFLLIRQLGEEVQSGLLLHRIHRHYVVCQLAGRHVLLRQDEGDRLLVGHIHHHPVIGVGHGHAVADGGVGVGEDGAGDHIDILIGDGPLPGLLLQNAPGPWLSAGNCGVMLVSRKLCFMVVAVERMSAAGA